LVWSVALEGKSDQERFKSLNWGLRTWDLWNWNDCLPREIHVNDSEAYFTGVTNDLEFLENFFALAHLNAKKTTQMAFINADWPPARRAYASASGP